MGITYGDHLIDSGYYDITPEQEREIEAAMDDHKTIWLQPWCEGCEQHASGTEGRQWCQDDVWEPCEECGAKPVKYKLAAVSSAKGNGND